MPYFSDTTGAFVKVSVTVGMCTHCIHLPVMDYYHKAMKLAQITATDVNKTIQRALTKAIAMHGCGIDVYRGEDYPSNSEDKKPADVTEEVLGKKKPIYKCEGCDIEIQQGVYVWSTTNKGKALCMDCQKKPENQ